jgi:hypothetical protein
MCMLSRDPSIRSNAAYVKHANVLSATSVHPIAIAIPLIAAGYFVVACWVTFAGGETSLILAVVTFILLMLLGLMVGGGYFARNAEPDRETTRSFREFLDGKVDIETGQITGREALWQIAVMPVALAVGSTIILICEVIVRN